MPPRLHHASSTVRREMRISPNLETTLPALQVPSDPHSIRIASSPSRKNSFQNSYLWRWCLLSRRRPSASPAQGPHSRTAVDVENGQSILRMNRNTGHCFATTLEDCFAIFMSAVRRSSFAYLPFKSKATSTIMGNGFAMFLVQNALHSAVLLASDHVAFAEANPSYLPFRSKATSTIMSSWPPTMLRWPSSTRMSRESTP